MPKMTAAELETFLHAAFPNNEGASHFRVEEIRDNYARVRLPYHERHLRPGGTLSGPVVMTMADTAVYMALLGMIGPQGLAATSNLNIHFLRRPAKKDLIGEARLLRLGQRSAVGEVSIFSDGEEQPVAHATVAYAIPAAGKA